MGKKKQKEIIIQMMREAEKLGLYDVDEKDFEIISDFLCLELGSYGCCTKGCTNKTVK